MCTGIFITNVLPDSRAHKSGLKPGYQILKINAFPLKESTHEEIVSLLTLKRAYILTCKDIGQLLSYIMRKFQKYSSFFFFFSESTQVCSKQENSKYTQVFRKNYKSTQVIKKLLSSSINIDYIT